jgi:hypothetical protein
MFQLPKKGLVTGPQSIELGGANSWGRYMYVAKKSLHDIQVDMGAKDRII